MKRGQNPDRRIRQSPCEGMGAKRQSRILNPEGRCLPFIVFCLLSSVLGSFAADVPLLAELQKGLAGTTNVLSGFVQEKHLALLRNPVILRGRLAVQQPARLAWEVSEPMRYKVVLDGSRVTQWDEERDKVETMSLGGNPVFKVVVGQLQAWFSGRFDVLTKDFTAEAQAGASGPTIVFIPKEGGFAGKTIRRVVLTFREDRRYIKDMLIEEVSGDRTLMTFTDTVLNTVIDPAIWEVKPHGR